MQKPYSSGLAGSQDDPKKDDRKRVREAPKRHLKSFKTSKRVPKMNPKIMIFQASFGPDLGLISIPNWTQS